MMIFSDATVTATKNRARIVGCMDGMQRKQSFTSRLGAGNIGRIETFGAGMRIANNQASSNQFLLKSFYELSYRRAGFSINNSVTVRSSHSQRRRIARGMIGRSKRKTENSDG
jgi:hypothetical protein